MSSLGKRMKRYETVYRNMLTPRIPVIIRVDGKAFHTFTKNMQPFDARLHDSMVSAALYVAENMQGCKALYVQSDEVTFLMTDYDDINTQGWFDYNHSKIVSVTASIMTAKFNEEIQKRFDDIKSLAFFDARAFSVPREDVINNFLWRCQDWKRNSLQMYARTFFSHNELHKKNSAAIHEMLHKIDKNWALLGQWEKNGSFFVKNGKDMCSCPIRPNFESIKKHINIFIREHNEKT